MFCARDDSSGRTVGTRHCTLVIAENEPMKIPDVCFAQGLLAVDQRLQEVKGLPEVG